MFWMQSYCMGLGESMFLFYTFSISCLKISRDVTLHCSNFHTSLWCPYWPVRPHLSASQDQREESRPPAPHTQSRSPLCPQIAAPMPDNNFQLSASSAAALEIKREKKPGSGGKEMLNCWKKKVLVSEYPGGSPPSPRAVGG